MMSFTLLTFTNSFPDMVTSVLMAKDKEEGPLFSIAGLFATYIFQTTVTIAFVIHKSDVEVQVDKKFFLKEIASASLITLVFLGFGLAGWISGVIILIFAVLYVIYVVASVILSRNSQLNHPLATLDLDQGKDTVENLDVHQGPLLAHSRMSAPRKSPARLNLISVDRTSLTPFESGRK